MPLFRARYLSYCYLYVSVDFYSTAWNSYWLISTYKWNYNRIYHMFYDNYYVLKTNQKPASNLRNFVMVYLWKSSLGYPSSTVEKKQLKLTSRYGVIGVPTSTYITNWPGTIKKRCSDAYFIPKLIHHVGRYLLPCVEFIMLPICRVVYRILSVISWIISMRLLLRNCFENSHY